jgi:hypothetical protein
MVTGEDKEGSSCVLFKDILLDGLREKCKNSGGVSKQTPPK